jgi:hypothetical protein
MRRPNHGTDPIFVDRSGRRRRLLTIVGCASGGLLTVTTVALLSGFTGVSPASLPGLPPFGNPGAAVQPAPSVAGRTPGASPRNLPAASSAAPSGAGSASPTVNPRRNVPTHTPSHHGKPK